MWLIKQEFHKFKQFNENIILSKSSLCAVVLRVRITTFNNDTCSKFCFIFTFFYWEKLGLNRWSYNICYAMKESRIIPCNSIHIIINSFISTLNNEIKYIENLSNIW